jgi:Ca2+-transporting ATPase
VTPRHKNLIVKTLQKSGNVVAMTGDGINDAPSIKSADIGIAMGKTGAEVTKSVADMVVSDDNFTTIVSAVSEGRRISSNVRKAVQFFISTNVAEVLSLLFATIFFAGEKFLLSTQLLWINLITDSFPVLALGVEKAGPENMISQPVRAEKAIFSRRSVAFMLFFGAYITAITVLTYTLSLHAYGSAVATTMTFLVISFAELFQAINVRTEFTSLKKCGLFSNGTLVLTLALAIIVNVLLCITPLGALLGVTTLALGQWAWVFGASISVVVVGEIYKFVIRKIKKLG